MKYKFIYINMYINNLLLIMDDCNTDDKKKIIIMGNPIDTK